MDREKKRQETREQGWETDTKQIIVIDTCCIVLKNQQSIVGKQNMKVYNLYLKVNICNLSGKPE